MFFFGGGKKWVLLSKGTPRNPARKRELQDNASKTSLGMVEPIYVEQGSNHLKWGIIVLCELTQIVLFTLVGSSDSSFHTMTWP